MSTIDIVFLVFDGVKQLDVVGPAEVFAEAAKHGAAYRLRYVSPSGEPVRTSIGSTLSTDARAEEVVETELLIVPGGDALVSSPIEPGLLPATRYLAARSHWVASVCTGAFLLGAAGLLAHRRATTHWRHAALLAKLYPEITVDHDALFVRDGRIYTSAGVSSGIDLALALVESQCGADIARSVAQELVVYMRRPGGQSQYSSLLDVSPDSRSVVRRVVDTITADPALPHTLQSLAAAAGVSPRHLARLFATEIGITPTKFVEQRRLETAKALLLRGETVALTASRAGFHNAETMRRVFVSRLGVAPSGYRARFASTDLQGIAFETAPASRSGEDGGA